MAALAEVPSSYPVGVYKTFGPVGPLYEVLAFRPATPQRDAEVFIRVILSGETLNYSFAHFETDPKAE